MGIRRVVASVILLTGWLVSSTMVRGAESGAAVPPLGSPLSPLADAVLVIAGGAGNAAARDDMRWRATKAVAAVGDADSALTISRAIESEPMRVAALRDAIAAMQQPDLFGELRPLLSEELAVVSRARPRVIEFWPPDNDEGEHLWWVWEPIPEGVDAAALLTERLTVAMRYARGGDRAARDAQLPDILEKARALNLDENAMRSLLKLTVALMRLGLRADAQAVLDRFMARAEREQDPYRADTIRHHIALALRWVRDFTQTERVLAHSTLASVHGGSLANLADSYYGAKRPEDAMRLRDEALRMARETTGDERSTLVMRVAITDIRMGQFARAVDLAAEIAGTERSPQQAFLGEHCRVFGAYPDALALFRLGVASAREDGDAVYEVAALVELARTQWWMGATRDALDTLAAAERVLGGMSSPAEATETHRRGIATLYADIGQMQGAVRVAQRAPEAERRDADLRQVAETLAAHGDSVGSAEVIAKVEDIQVRRDAQCGVGSALAKFGSFDDALASVRTGCDGLAEISDAARQALADVGVALIRARLPLDEQTRWAARLREAAGLPK